MAILEQPQHYMQTSSPLYSPRSTYSNVPGCSESIQYNAHLAHEVKNYQEFPEHFFQNWSGYNLVWPLLHLVPVNALIPQFYSYYVPDDNKTSCSFDHPYLSPILLLEHCGISLDPATLSLVDREECALLLLRFNHVGWLHESIAEHNVVMKFSCTEYFLSLLLHTEYHPNPTPQQGELSGCFSIVKLIFLPVNGKQGQQKLAWGGGCWLQ